MGSRSEDGECEYGWRFGRVEMVLLEIREGEMVENLVLCFVFYGIFFFWKW